MRLIKSILKSVLILLLLPLVTLESRAQSVSINTSGAAPDPSAMLDISASDKGLLIPRVQLDDASTQAPVASTPVEGLLIYNATGSEPAGFYYWDGGQWVSIDAGGMGFNTSLTLNGNTLDLQDGGGTVSADLSSLADSTDPDSVVGNEAINSVNLNGSNQLEVDEAGTVFTQDLSSLIDDADPDPTNEYNTSLDLSNDSLLVTDNGGTLKQDLSSLGGGGYWDRDASNGLLYPSNIGDSVGIGTTDPKAELHIKGKDVDITNNTATFKIWEQKDGDSLYMDGDEITGGLGGGAGDENALLLQHEASEHVVMSTGSGMVGIGAGANYPSYKLHVQESSTSELARFRNMQTGELNATGIHAMAIEDDGNGVGGEFQGGRQGVHGYVTTSAQDYPDQELTGVLGRSTNGTASADNIGVKGYTSNSDSLNAGVYGFALGQDAVTGGSAVDPADYGVYGTVRYNGRNTTWAGYFNGDLAYTGTLSSPSDRHFKKNVRDIDPVLSKLEELEVHSYDFQRMDHMNLPNGKQYGFMAQEVEKVFPSLVEETIFNASRIGKDHSVEGKRYKALNYIGFIPLLTRAVQEQQKKLGKKDERIQELRENVAKNEKELEKLRSQLQTLKKQLEEREE